MVAKSGVFLICQIFNPEICLSLTDTPGGESSGTGFFIHNVVRIKPRIFLLPSVYIGHPAAFEILYEMIGQQV